jgi:hypothetical protein
VLLKAYEGGAHSALEYPSWGAYFVAEFGGSKTRAYELLDAGRVVQAIESQSAIAEQPTEIQARELAPLVRKKPEMPLRPAPIGPGPLAKGCPYLGALSVSYVHH